MQNIDDFRTDVLKEIGNIGSGNFANSLSILLDTDVGVSIPNVQTLDANAAANLLGGPENISVGIFFEVQGDVTGLIMLIINLELADKLLIKFVNEGISEDGSFTGMQFSALSEIGNILAYSYANSISSLLQMDIKLSTPRVCVDMNGAILCIPSIQMAEFSDKILLIETHFSNKTIDSGAEIFLIPDESSYNKIMAALGV